MSVIQSHLRFPACLGLDGHLKELEFPCHLSPTLIISSTVSPWMGASYLLIWVQPWIRGAGRPRPRCWQIPGPVGPSSGWQTSLCAHKLSVTLMRAPDPCTRVPPPCPHSNLITFPRPRLLTPGHLGEGLHRWVLRGHSPEQCLHQSWNSAPAPSPIVPVFPM